MARFLDTPCPIPSSTHFATNDNLYDDITENLEHTTAFHASFCNTRPRRRRPGNALTQNFVIHEDETIEAPKLTQPAKRKVLPRPTISHGAYGQDRISGSTKKSPIRLAQVIAKDTVPEDAHRNQRNNVIGNRVARRQNLYIPSDDTTQPSIWMGVFKSGESYDAPDTSNVKEMTGIATRTMRERRNSTRSPLQQRFLVQPVEGPVHDSIGEPTGKENLPPGHLSEVIDSMRVDTKCSPPKPLKQPSPLRPWHGNSQSKAISAVVLESMTSTRSGALHKSPPSRVRNIGQTQSEVGRLRTTKKCSGSADPLTSLIKTDNSPDTYADAWTDQQEVTVSQVINDVFDRQASLQPGEPSQTDMLTKLLIVYQQADIVSLRSRLQKSIASGSLVLSRIAAIKLQALSSDVGRRKQFVDFWLETYNHELLHVALEAVTGRQVCLTTSANFKDIKWTASSRRTALRLFLETFIIRNVDIPDKQTLCENDSTLARLILFRALLLVKLLDMLRTEDIADSKLLFRRQSVHKTSISALGAVTNLLNPTAGNQARALESIGFQVTHQQSLLDEVVFKVKNVAVDLRDGILLAKLVEILRANPSCQPGACCESAHRGHSVRGDLLGDLRVPALSRNDKLYNAELILGTIRNDRSVTPRTASTTASDIVDGHRERTLQLLNSLLLTYGISYLCSPDCLQSELKHLESKSIRTDGSTITEYLAQWSQCFASASITAKSSESDTSKAIVAYYTSYLNLNTNDYRETLRALGCSTRFIDLVLPDSNVYLYILDQQTIMLILGVLAGKLIPLAQRMRAATKIQRAWRRHRRMKTG